VDPSIEGDEGGLFGVVGASHSGTNKPVKLGGGLSFRQQSKRRAALVGGSQHFGRGAAHFFVLVDVTLTWGWGRGHQRNRKNMAAISCIKSQMKIEM
jgi:hypothetical protein